jgi:hypothetical protein
LKLSHKVSKDGWFQINDFRTLEYGGVVILDLSEERLDALLYFQWSVYAMPFIGGCIEFDLIIVPLIVDLAED